jgi:hypothetical protein
MIFLKVYICEECYHIQKRFRKSKCEKCKSTTFVCDEWIAPTIQLLNRKGYYTQYCCAGHPVMHETAFFGTYIKFKEYLPINAPKGFTTNNTCIDYQYKIITTYETHGKRLTALAKILDELHQWAENLPTYD